MAEYRPGTEAAAWVQTVYSKKIHINAYNRRKIAKNFLSLNDESQEGKPGQTFQFFTHGNLARTALTSVTPMSFTYIANTEVAISGSAQALVVPVQVNQLTLNRMMMDPRDTFKSSIESSLGEGMDAAAALTASTMISNQVGSGASVIDKSLVSQAVAKVSIGAKEYWEPGVKPAYFYFHPNQITYVQNVTDWTAAYARGDKENPNVGGIVVSAAGLTFVMSPVVYSAGGVMYNFIQTEMSHGFGYNQRTTVSVQPFDGLFKIFGLCDFMTYVLKDAYGCLVQTQV